jgi:DNA-binding HxlR family transcriptional regulator
MALSRSLTELLASGILTKTVYNEIPVRVDYQLTESGRALVQRLHDLCQWGKLNVEADVRQ